MSTIETTEETPPDKLPFVLIIEEDAALTPWPLELTPAYQSRPTVAQMLEGIANETAREATDPGCRMPRRRLI